MKLVLFIEIEINLTNPKNICNNSKVTMKTSFFLDKNISKSIKINPNISKNIKINVYEHFVSSSYYNYIIKGKFVNIMYFYHLVLD